MSDLPLTGEVSNTKLAAVFADESSARHAAAAVAGHAGLAPPQVKLLTPREPHPNLRLEPEGQGIWRTILRAHLWLGLAGLALGLFVFALMYGYGVPAIAASPWIAGPVFAVLGAIGGLLLGGLVSLRPDHDRYVQAARGALAQGRSVVVVHALGREQAKASADLLQQLGGEVTRTL